MRNRAQLALSASPPVSVPGGRRRRSLRLCVRLAPPQRRFGRVSDLGDNPPMWISIRRADYSAARFDCKTAHPKLCYKRNSLKLEDRERMVRGLRLAWLLGDREPG